MTDCANSSSRSPPTIRSHRTMATTRSPRGVDLFRETLIAILESEPLEKKKLTAQNYYRLP